MVSLQVSWLCWPAWWCSQWWTQLPWELGTPGWPSNSCCGPTQGSGTMDSPLFSPLVTGRRVLLPISPLQRWSVHCCGDKGKYGVPFTSRGCWDFYWCLKILKARLALTAQARPQGIANPIEDFMHHITFAKVGSLCVCVCLFIERRRLQEVYGGLLNILNTL